MPNNFPNLVEDKISKESRKFREPLVEQEWRKSVIKKKESWKQSQKNDTLNKAKQWFLYTSRRKK